MYNMVTVVDNTVLYNWNLLRIKIKCSHQKKKINMWGDECVNELDGENPLTYIYKTTTMYTLKILQFYKSMIYKNLNKAEFSKKAYKKPIGKDRRKQIPS